MRILTNSAILGFFLVLASVKLKSGLSLVHCAVWLFLAKVRDIIILLSYSFITNGWDTWIEFLRHYSFILNVLYIPVPTDLYHFIPYTKKVSTPLFTVTTILEIIKFVLFFLYSYRMRYNKGVHTIKVTATKTGMFFTNDVYWLPPWHG